MGNNVFKEDLTSSEKNSDWFNPYYLKFFKNVTGWEPVTVKDAQLSGIDRYIHLKDWRDAIIDEKYRPERHCNDVALEYKHVHPDGYVGLGWVEQNHMTHFIAYGFPLDRICLFIDFPDLYAKWPYYKELWISRYFLARARNPKDPSKPEEYTSWSCCVPVGVLSSVVGVVKISL